MSSVILYALLAVLVAVSLALLLPLLAPVRSWLLPLLSRLVVPSYVLLALSSALLLSSWLSYTRHHALSASASRSSMEYFAHAAHEAEAERDCVLSLAVLLLLGFVVRLCALLREAQSMSNRFIAMERQAKGAAAAYMQQQQHSALTAQPAAAASTAPPTASSSPSSALQAAVAALTAEKAALEKKLVAMERQARSASDAFLSSESSRQRDVSQQLEVARAELQAVKSDNAKLKEQLEDFTIVLGDAKKKKI